jgi:glycine betaine/proline transport system ATP-binding protein
MQTIEKFENKNGKLSNDLEIVNESDLLSKLIETSVTKDKPIIVHNSQKQVVGVISQADLLKAVIEGGDGE